MKTAISIPDDLFEEVSRLAKDESISRSKIFAQAVREYVEKRKNRRIFQALNEAYQDEESIDEREFRKFSRKYYARKIRKEKW